MEVIVTGRGGGIRNKRPRMLIKLWATLLRLIKNLRRHSRRVIPWVSTIAARWDVEAKNGLLADARVRPYNYSHPLGLDSFAASASLYDDLVNTRAFRRLDSIRFLGGIDYVLVRSPNGSPGNVRFTRLQHSLGVARLALQYAARAGIGNGEARLLFVAALLHDIGHAPLSHSLEPVFEEHFGLTHHIATENIISGRVEIGRELHEILNDHKVDIERVLALISGADSDFNAFFSGPINFDTIEGVSRSKLYGGRSPGTLNPSSILNAAISRASDADRDVVDEFWNQKNEAYKYIINSRSGVLADYACQHFMRANLGKILAVDYYGTEDIMFRKLPGLKQLLSSPSFEAEIGQMVSGPVTYIARTFFVDAKYDFFSRMDKERYKQVRESAVLEIRSTPFDGSDMTKDLFDEHCVRSVEKVL